jgi:hypothetical protein
VVGVQTTETAWKREHVLQERSESMRCSDRAYSRHMFDMAKV